jgi:hypothetical protein
MDLKIADFIWVKPKSLTPSFCKKIIKKFEEEPNKYDGVTGRGLNKAMKDTKDFLLKAEDDKWKDEDRVFYNALKLGLVEYQEYLSNMHRSCLPNISSLVDGGYKIQRYEPNGFYDWHNDFFIDSIGSRIYVFMWYLNTIKKSDGGYTEFLDGTKLQPRCGSLVFFPATWTYLHRGYRPKVRKYLCNGWMYSG